MDLETAAMELVGNAGESRSLSFEALSLAKEGNFQKAEKKLNETKKSMLKAHEIQTQLICKEADGEDFKIGLIMVHAQDHLMCSILARDLVQELINIYKKI